MLSSHGVDGNLDWVVPDDEHDEYQFVVCPIVLGNGRPLLSNVSKNLRLDLLEAKQYESADVLLRYAPSIR
jgi:dihydrofolate reductase